MQTSQHVNKADLDIMLTIHRHNVSRASGTGDCRQLCDLGIAGCCFTGQKAERTGCNHTQGCKHYFSVVLKLFLCCQPFLCFRTSRMLLATCRAAPHTGYTRYTSQYSNNTACKIGARRSSQYASQSRWCGRVGQVGRAVQRDAVHLQNVRSRRARGLRLQHHQLRQGSHVTCHNEAKLTLQPPRSVI